MTRNTEKEASSPAQVNSEKRNHRNAQILDGHLHQPSMDPATSSSKSTSSSSNIYEPTPGAGKYQIKAEKLVWQIEKKMRLSSSSGDDFVGAEKILDKKTDSQLHTSQDQKYVMSGALPADDDRCELGDACFRKKIREDRGRATTTDDSQEKHQRGDVRGWDMGWQIPSSKLSWEERETKNSNSREMRRT